MKPRNIRTLLVDDSPMILKALSQMLSKEEGFTVVGSATDGCQALRYVSILSPDLVLMGLHLSKLNGAQATRQIKNSMNPPIVFMVMPEDNPSYRAISEAAGADAFVATSANLEVGLSSRLREWFGPNAARIRKCRRVRWTRTGESIGKRMAATPLPSLQTFAS